MPRVVLKLHKKVDSSVEVLAGSVERLGADEAEGWVEEADKSVVASAGDSSVGTGDTSFGLIGEQKENEQRRADDSSGVVAAFLEPISDQKEKVQRKPGALNGSLLKRQEERKERGAGALDWAVTRMMAAW